MERVNRGKTTDHREGTLPGEKAEREVEQAAGESGSNPLNNLVEMENAPCHFSKL